MALSNEVKQLAIGLTVGAKTRDDWLGVMRFGRDELLRDQPFLLWLVVERAQAEQLQGAIPLKQSISDVVDVLMTALDLTICESRG